MLIDSETDELSRLSKRIEELVAQLERLPDMDSRALMQECLQAVLALHSAGLKRMIQIAEESGAGSERLIDAWLRDGVSSGLLLIHGLHPKGLAERLNGALEKVRPYIRGHGGNIELVGVESGVATLRLHGTCKGCPSSAATMEMTVKQAISEACPDLQDVVVEGMAGQTASA